MGLKAQNQPPVVTGSGNQPYCPLSQIPIVENFNIVDPDDTSAEAIYIQISSGYEQGQDILLVNGVHPNVVASWNSQQGKLTLSGVGGAQVSYTDLIAAVYDVVFQSSSLTVSGEKYFSLTLGEANYLPSNGHYYEYIPNSGISWTQAFALANSSNYYGLQGYLATITSQEEADLCGEQAASTGWIGGSDSETEGVWKWMNGPELGLVFWNGLANGSTPNYANWNNGEPNNLGDEDYAHITDCSSCIDGSWNDLPNTGGGGEYFPQGYVVEYGGTPGDPTLQISASTSIYVPEIIGTQDYFGCGPSSAELHAITYNAGDMDGVLWFDVPTGGSPIAFGPIFITPTLYTTTTYYALASENGCTLGERVPVTATIYALPVIDNNVVLKNCDEDGVPDGITVFNLNEADDLITLGNFSYTVTYYESYSDAEISVNEINPSPFINTISIVFARVETGNGCFEIATVNLQVSTTSFPPNYSQELFSCDDDTLSDGLHVFDLTTVSQDFLDQFPLGQNLSVHYYYNLEDAQLEQNEILNVSNYENVTPFFEVLYVRVESDDNGDCYGISPNLHLEVFQRPYFEVYPPEDYCTGGDSVLLETFNANGNYSYEWIDALGSVIGNDSFVYVNSGGNFTVSAISPQGCESFPVTVEVFESSIASISDEDISTTNFTDSNTISIDTSNLGLGDYEFALDHGLYQDEPFFDSVIGGSHLISVRDKNGCGVVSIEVNIMGFPKFFTPNGDGYNDTWNIAGFNDQFTGESNIRIFDRYGKLLKEISPYGNGWDGVFNNSFVPTDDYWYVASLVSSDESIKTITGHFTLKR